MKGAVANLEEGIPRRWAVRITCIMLFHHMQALAHSLQSHMPRLPCLNRSTLPSRSMENTTSGIMYLHQWTQFCDNEARCLEIYYEKPRKLYSEGQISNVQKDRAFRGL